MTTDVYCEYSQMVTSVGDVTVTIQSVAGRLIELVSGVGILPRLQTCLVNIRLLIKVLPLEAAIGQRVCVHFTYIFVVGCQCELWLQSQCLVRQILQSDQCSTKRGLSSLPWFCYDMTFVALSRNRKCLIIPCQPGNGGSIVTLGLSHFCQYQQGNN